MYRKYGVKRKKLAVAAFRPPPVETMFISGLLALQAVFLLTTAILLVSALIGAGWPEGRWWPMVLLPVYLAGFFWGLGQQGVFWASFESTVMAEGLGLLVVVRLLTLPLNFNQGWLGPAFGLDALFTILAWNLSRQAAQFYATLFPRPVEFEIKSKDHQTLSRNRREEYRQFKGRWLWMGAIEAGLAMATAGLPARGEQNAANGPAALSLAVLFFLLSLPLSAWARLRYLRTGWSLQGLAEPERLSRRWVIAIAGLVGLALIVALGLWGLAVAAPLRVQDLDLRQIPPFSWYAPQSGQPAPVTNIARPVQTTGPENWIVPPWLAFLALAPLLVLIVCVPFIVLLMLGWLTRAGWVSPRWRDIKLWKLWRSLVEWWRNWLRPEPEQAGRATNSTLTAEAEPGKAGRGGRGWFRPHIGSLSARGRVRYYYRQMVRQAGKAGRPRWQGQTPAEFAGELGPALPEIQAREHLDDLTRLYEEARFSPHPIEPAQAERSQQNSRRLAAHFRRFLHKKSR